MLDDELSVFDIELPGNQITLPGYQKAPPVLLTVPGNQVDTPLFDPGYQAEPVGGNNNELS